MTELNWEVEPNNWEGKFERMNDKYHWAGYAHLKLFISQELSTAKEQAHGQGILDGGKFVKELLAKARRTGFEEGRQEERDEKSETYQLLKQSAESIRTSERQLLVEMLESMRFTNIPDTLINSELDVDIEALHQDSWNEALNEAISKLKHHEGN